jgi:Flp pilus assembly protein TadG
MRIATKQDRSAPGRRRRGVLMAAELVFIFPVLMMFFLGIVEFYMLVAVKIDLLNASRAAVRTAAGDGYTFKTQASTDATNEAKQVLGTGRLSKNATVTITWAEDLQPSQTAGAPDWVEAKVEVEARKVIPDILGWLGFSLGHRHLVAATRMRQE